MIQRRSLNPMTIVVVSTLSAIIPFARGALAQPAERVAEIANVAGLVFEDRNGNGIRDTGESGMPGVAVSDQARVVTTDAQGRFSLDAAGYGLVYVVQPDGYAARGPFWARAEPGVEVTFPLVGVNASREFTFVHASDTHLDAESLPRMRRLRALVDSLRPALLVITGDLVRDALRVPDTVAAGRYEMLVRELGDFPVPVYTVPGNHENFGIERHHSLVSPAHPLYGKRMYRSFLGPNYYSFTYGGVHFVGLDTVDYDDLWYHGHVDSLQLEWLRRDLTSVAPDMPVVTFNHIPLASSVPTLSGYTADGVAPTLIRIDGHQYFRHAVYNAADVLEVLGSRLEIALGGHFHRHERVSFVTAAGVKRFYQTAAVVGPETPAAWPPGIISGVTLYRVKDGTVDDGTFIPLDP